MEEAFFGLKYVNVKRIYPNKQLDCLLQYLTPAMVHNRGDGSREHFANQCKYYENNCWDL